MTEPVTPVVHLADLALEPFEHGSLYRSLDAGLGGLLGLTQLGAAYSEVPPGKSACPFHVHHVEDELFFVLEGTGEYRFGEQRFAVSAGSVLGAPRGGPEYAHQLINTGTLPLKYLSISSRADTDICEYPDSDKFQVISRLRKTGDAHFRFVGRMSAHLDYFDGEAGA